MLFTIKRIRFQQIHNLPRFIARNPELSFGPNPFSIPSQSHPINRSIRRLSLRVVDRNALPYLLGDMILSHPTTMAQPLSVWRIN